MINLYISLIFLVQHIANLLRRRCGRILSLQRLHRSSSLKNTSKLDRLRPMYKCLSQNKRSSPLTGKQSIDQDTRGQVHVLIRLSKSVSSKLCSPMLCPPIPARWITSLQPLTLYVGLPFCIVTNSIHLKPLLCLRLVGRMIRPLTSPTSFFQSALGNASNSLRVHLV